MPDFSILASAAPYHLLSYGTLVGSNIFQSYINGIVSYRALPRPQFATLQQALFPVYFSIQTALPVAMALTYPGSHSPLRSTPSGLTGFFDPENRFSVLAPITAIFLMNMSNLLVIGPATTQVMRERKHQETKDGKKSYDSPPHSKEMTRLNQKFGRYHGASTLMNMGALLVAFWYGMALSARIQ